MAAEVLLQCSQERAASQYAEPDKTSLHPYTV